MTSTCKPFKCLGNLVLIGAAVLMAALAWAAPAAADFRLCNATPSRVGVALGYKDSENWVTEGWWNIAASSCETLLKGNLGARYYYVYAIDYDHGGEWGGAAFMCTRGKEFTIRGVEECSNRGFDRTGFFEIDTGEQRSWTVQLSESGDGAASAARAEEPRQAFGARRGGAGQDSRGLELRGR